MGLLDRIGILVKSNIRAMIEAEDPEKILDRSVNDMQEILARYHQNLAQSMADLNLHEQQYSQSATQAQEWEKRAIFAIQNGDENLAREALSQMKIHLYSAMTLNSRLDYMAQEVEVLKRVIEMQTELVQLRQILEQLMATLKSKEAEYNQCTLQLQEWDQQYLLALQNGDENLANENLRQKENYGSLAETLKSELDLQLMQIDTLKKNFISIQGKIRDNTTITDYLIKLPPLESDNVDEELAALKRKVIFNGTANYDDLPRSDAAQLIEVDTLKKDLIAIEDKISKSSCNMSDLPPLFANPVPRRNDFNYEVNLDPELELLRRQIQNLPPKDNC